MSRETKALAIGNSDGLIFSRWILNWLHFECESNIFRVSYAVYGDTHAYSAHKQKDLFKWNLYQWVLMWLGQARAAMNMMNDNSLRNANDFMFHVAACVGERHIKTEIRWEMFVLFSAYCKRRIYADEFNRSLRIWVAKGTEYNSLPLLRMNFGGIGCNSKAYTTSFDVGIKSPSWLGHWVQIALIAACVRCNRVCRMPSLP